ncbi:MAGL2 protein, partial [Acromyrmex insinuator]
MSHRNGPIHLQRKKIVFHSVFGGHSHSMLDFSCSHYIFLYIALFGNMVLASHLEEDHGGSTYEEKTKTVEIPIIKKFAIPIPHPVPVEVPKEIKIPVPQPYKVPIEIPHPYPVEVIKHVEIPIEKPEPVVIEKHVPYVVEKPYPVYVEKKFPVPVAKPYPVHIPIYKHVVHYTSSKGKGWK